MSDEKRHWLPAIVQIGGLFGLGTAIGYGLSLVPIFDGGNLLAVIAAAPFIVWAMRDIRRPAPRHPKGWMPAFAVGVGAIAYEDATRLVFTRAFGTLETLLSVAVVLFFLFLMVRVQAKALALKSR